MGKSVCKFIFLFCAITLSNVGADHFPFEPPENFILDPSLIKVRHPVTTKNVTAQLYFDQGLTLLYAFNHDASYWSFLRATQTDPDLAMGYWGMALALGQNINLDITNVRQKKAFELAHKALALTKNTSLAEKDYIQALAQRYTDNDKPDLEKLAKAYYSAMGKIVEKYPDDVDASVLYSESVLDLSPWKQWTNDGKALPETEAAVALLEKVLKRDPQHLGANHYYIHIIEASKHPEWALASAERLRTMMPASGHILHMPAHIYLLLGDYHLAAKSNEDAVAADRAYVAKYGMVGVYPMHYMTHNLYFLSRAYGMEGRYEDAKHAATELSEMYVPHFSYMPSLEYYVTTPYFISLRFHAWDDVLTIPEPPKELTVAHALWHFSRAYAFYNMANTERGRHEQNLFAEESALIPPNAEFGMNKAQKVLKIADLLLSARIAIINNHTEDALKAYENAVAEQDSMSYNEPPDWFFPIREAYGAYLLQLGKVKNAEEIFREDLNSHPRNGRSLFGLQESLKKQNRTHDLYWVSQEFDKAWFYSDTKLTIQSL
ncbi:MAG: hypothetical protein WC222_01860 [Parachlamydiales bacterium]|jgi:hypothetical protein